jgi:transposase InsO family protein
VRRRPLPPAHFDTLSAEAQERALFLEHHITEVLDGIPAGSPPLTTPRPGYDPASTSLAQRERTKIAELQAAGAPFPVKSFQRYRRNYERQGIDALIDGRLVKRRSAAGRVDQRYIAVVLEVLSENNTQSSRTETALKWFVDRRVKERFAETVAIPSYQTFNRLMKRLRQARHATGSARTRQSREHQPAGPFSTLVASRPGEWMQIDTTPFDVGIRLDDSVEGRVELTGLVDAATRTIAAAVLRPTTKAVDAALLLAKAMTPEPMRPGWTQAVSMAHSALPYQIMRSVDDRLENAAARPTMVPENIVYDSGAVFLSTTFRSACRAFGINPQPAHKDTPTDKPIIERTLGSAKTLFAQYVTGYLGSSVENRGKGAEKQAVFSLAELQDLLDEWVVVSWQNRKHDSLRDPLNPGRMLTPNEKYAASSTRTASRSAIACTTLTTSTLAVVRYPASQARARSGASTTTRMTSAGSGCAITTATDSSWPTGVSCTPCRNLSATRFGSTPARSKPTAATAARPRKRSKRRSMTCSDGHRRLPHRGHAAANRPKTGESLPGRKLPPNCLPRCLSVRMHRSRLPSHHQTTTSTTSRTSSLYRYSTRRRNLIHGD